MIIKIKPRLLSGQSVILKKLRWEFNSLPRQNYKKFTKSEKLNKVIIFTNLLIVKTMVNLFCFNINKKIIPQSILVSKLL